jgi:DNA-binding XRE family transcriptional regulator
MKNNVKTFREEQGLSLSELAMASGLSITTIQRMETGDCPTLITAYSISKILGKNIYHIWPNELKVIKKTVKSVINR